MNPMLQILLTHHHCFNRPPVAVDDVETTNPCQPIIIDVLGNVTDPKMDLY